MEGEDVVVDIPMCSNVLASEMSNSGSNKTEEITRKCPLCQSNIRLFFINYNEKFLMCENTECEFPFGCEELQFVTIDNEMAMAEVCSMRTGETMQSAVHTCSLVSNSGLSEMERINQLYESADEGEPAAEETNKNTTEADKQRRLQKKRQKAQEDNIDKHVKDIIELRKSLVDLTNEDKPRPALGNPVWITKLSGMGEMAGMDLVTPEELSLVEKEEPNLGLGELKINIDPGSTDGAVSIQIAIHNTDCQETT